MGGGGLVGTWPTSSNNAALQWNIKSGAEYGECRVLMKIYGANDQPLFPTSPSLVAALHQLSAPRCQIFICFILNRGKSCNFRVSPFPNLEKHFSPSAKILCYLVLFVPDLSMIPKNCWLSDASFLPENNSIFTGLYLLEPQAIGSSMF